MARNILIVHQKGNRKGKSDATGAFIPEAKAFQRLHGGAMVGIKHSDPPYKRAKDTLKALKFSGNRPLDALAYFGHGSQKGFPSLGFSMNAPGIRSAKSFGLAIADAIDPGGLVILYSCLTGKGFGVADFLGDFLREDCDRPDVRVLAHTVRGHTTKAPFCEYSGEGAGDLGIPLIKKSDPLFKVWRKRLDVDQTFRLSFPFLNDDEIRFLLTGKPKGV